MITLSERESQGETAITPSTGRTNTANISFEDVQEGRLRSGEFNPYQVGGRSNGGTVD